MRQVTTQEFQDRVYAWAQVPQAERDRLPRVARDGPAGRVLEYWARGKCWARITSPALGQYKLYSDRGGKVNPDQGKISFQTWLEHDQVYGNGKPHNMPMVPRR